MLDVKDYYANIVGSEAKIVKDYVTREVRGSERNRSGPRINCHRGINILLSQHQIAGASVNRDKMI